MDIESKTIQTLIIGGSLFFGLVFAIMTGMAFGKLKGSCKSSFIRNGWTAIQALSVCFVVAALSFVMCIFIEGPYCYGALKEKNVIGSSNPYFIILALISGSIMGVGFGMINKYQKLEKEDKGSCDDENDLNKQMVIAITVLTAIVFTVCVGRLSWVLYKNYVEIDVKTIKDRYDKAKKFNSAEETPRELYPRDPYNPYNSYFVRPRGG
jgi:hypothetical protein